jgi:hypothetical protein
MTRTTLEVRQQPGGLFSIVNNELSTGNVFYVDSVTGTNAVGYGTSPDAPVASIAYAIANLCTAAKGDVILVMPGHTETIIGAAGVAASVAGVRIIGLGRGRNRPVVNYTTAVGASFDISAANVRVENIVFTPIGVDNITAAINVTAADAEIVNCDFQHASASAQAALVILTTAAGTRLTVQGCRFYGTTDAGTNAAIRLVGGDGHTIRDNTFSGAYASGTGPIENVTTACTNAIICDNRIQNFTAACTKAMVFVATSTGQISRNYMQILSGTAPISGAAMSWAGANYYAAVVATAGSLI